MPVIQDFTNTQIAFQYKNTAELRKSALIFRILNYKLIVKLGTSLTRLALFLQLPVKLFIKPTIFRQFCGGETIRECEVIMEKISQYGVKSILDYAVEGEKNERGYDACVEEVKVTLKKASLSGYIPFSVFKITGISSFSLLEKVSAEATLSQEEQKSWERVQQRVQELCAMAYELNVPLMIDSEESWIQKAIDQLVYPNMKRYNTERAIVYNTFQMYRVDMMKELRRAFHYAATHNYYLGVKLVRGAYMEKERRRAAEKGYPDPILPSKEATDDAYNESIRFCIDNLQRVYMVSGSHNEYSNYYLTLLMEKYNVKPSDPRVYFAQLFGMSDHLSFNLAYHDFNTVKYLPYGPVHKVMPYLFRRAEENTAIAGQSSREYQLVTRELKRRKNQN